MRLAANIRERVVTTKWCTMLLSFALAVVQWAVLMAAADQKEYTHLVGRPSRICGRVVTYAVEGEGCEVRLDLGRPGPGIRRSTSSCPPAARAAFTPLPEDTFLFQDICVTGLWRRAPRACPRSSPRTRHSLKSRRTQSGAVWCRGPPRVRTRRAAEACEEVLPDDSREGMDRQIQGLVVLDARRRD